MALPGWSKEKYGARCSLRDVDNVGGKEEVAFAGIDRPLDGNFDAFERFRPGQEGICTFYVRVDRSNTIKRKIKVFFYADKEILVEHYRICVEEILRDPETDAPHRRQRTLVEASAQETILHRSLRWIEICKASAYDDCTVYRHCTVYVSILYRLPVETDTLIARKHLPDLSTDFEKLFLDEATSDVTFKVGEDIIPAHKLILTARVPYYERLFSTDMKEARTGQIDVKDVDTKTMKQVIKFIYCGKLPDELRFNFNDPELTIQKKREAQEAAMAILVVADRYGILALKETCTELIARLEQLLD